MSRAERARMVVGGGSMGERMLCFEGFDEAVVGVVVQHDGAPGICYDRDLILRILVQRDGMSAEEAERFTIDNVDLHYAGRGTPVVLHRVPDEGEHAACAEFSADEGDPVAR